MIDDERTLELYGYTSDELGKGSHKHVIVICEGCGTYRAVENRRHKEGDLCVSCALKNRWDNQEARDRQRDIQKKRYEDPSERDRTSMSIKKYYEDHPEACEKQSDMMKTRYEDPAEREKQSAAQSKRWDAPEEREKQSAAQSKRYEDPAEREKQSAAIKNHHEEHPETREKIGLGVKKHYEEHPETREKQSIAHKKYYEDTPGAREKQRAATLKRYEDPKEREKLSAAMQGIPYDEWTGFVPPDRPYLMPTKRCRPLNEWFPNCNRHHVDAATIIHIPADMHTDNRHNIKTGKGMRQINSLAFEYLFSE